jgi:putative DNA methylase
MTTDKRLPVVADRRLIEDYLPIEAISAEARREKSVRQGHISTLHLWWARRPLVACRAAVYGALVPAPENRESKIEDGDSILDSPSSTFVSDLCKYPGDPKKIESARRHILQAHAERLTQERGELVTVEDIEAGRAPRCARRWSPQRLPCHRPRRRHLSMTRSRGSRQKISLG